MLLLVVGENREFDRRNRARVQSPQAVSGSDEAAHAAVADDVADALGGGLRIERDVDGARLDHAEHGGHQFDALGRIEADAVALVDAALAQEAGQLVRTLFEFAVRESLAARGNGRLVRMKAGTLTQQLLQNIWHFPTPGSVSWTFFANLLRTLRS